MQRSVKGSLLMTADELETVNIPEDQRDQSVFDFFVMKMTAERRHDQFYILEEVYSHSFSYGVFYPSFINMPWEEFSSYDSLKGISQTSYQMMLAFCMGPNAISLSDIASFQVKEEPLARTGYCNPSRVGVFVNNTTTWENWHRKWYISHQDQIDWGEVDDNCWLPRRDLIYGIFRRELLIHLGKDSVDGMDDNQVSVAFYDQIMKCKGTEIEAYASKIGGEVCRCNYYVEEPVLSKLEQLAADSLREVFSIKNRDGRIQFISIDFKHGMFEFLDEKGEHQGEFRFDGTPNSKRELNHSFKCMDQWHKKTGR